MIISLFVLAALCLALMITLMVSRRPSATRRGVSSFRAAYEAQEQYRRLRDALSPEDRKALNLTAPDVHRYHAEVCPGSSTQYGVINYYRDGKSANDRLHKATYITPHISMTWLLRRRAKQGVEFLRLLDDPGKVKPNRLTIYG